METIILIYPLFCFAGLKYKHPSLYSSLREVAIRYSNIQWFDWYRHPKHWWYFLERKGTFEKSICCFCIGRQDKYSQGEWNVKRLIPGGKKRCLSHYFINARLLVGGNIKQWLIENHQICPLNLVLSLIPWQEIEESALIPHIAEASSKKYPYEVLFRSLHKLLMDTATSEYDQIFPGSFLN